MIIVQILVAIIIIGLVLIQQRGTGLGIAFGGSNLSYGTKQGAEKMVFWLTIFFTLLFVLLSLAHLLAT